MLGIIATIIAIVKKHYTFAAVVGIWTAVAWAFYLTGAFEYVYAPGIIFLYIAIFNLKSPEAEAKKRAEDQLKSKEKKRIFYCKRCGKMVEGFETQARETCPTCNIAMIKTDFPCSLWDQMTESEQAKQRSLWDDGKKGQDPELIKELRARRDRKDATFFSDHGSEKSGETEGVPMIATVPNSTSQSSAPVQKFCRKCGKKMIPGAKFCNACGTPIVVISYYDADNTVADSSICCPSCGFIMKPGKKFCTECGASLKSSNEVKQPDLPPVHAFINDVPEDDQKKIEELPTLNLSSLPPKLRRAFIFIEDGEWDRAEEYIETILDEDPENAYAYLGKAMIKAKVASPYSPTAEEIVALKEDRAYSRAKQYADDELKNVIASWESKSTGCSDTLAQPVGVKRESGQIYLVETEDGMLVDVPSDKLDSWSKAQSERVVDEELAAREKELLDRALDTLYGDREVANKAETDSVSFKDSAAQASSLHVDEQIKRGDNNKPPKKWKDIYSILIIVFLIALATTVYVVINKQSKDSQISSSSPTGLKEYIEEKKAEETEDDRYAKALNDIKNGEISGFDEARKMALAGTISSAKYEEIIEATYQEGVKLYTDGELSQAIPFFERISTYKNSVAYLTHIYTTLNENKGA